MIRWVNVFLSFLAMSTVFGQTALENGNKAMLSESYQEALEHYEEVIQSQLESPELYGNMGMAAYKLGDLAKATLNYERVLRLDPHNSEAKNILKRINSELPIRVSVIPDFVLSRWYRAFYRLMSSSMWVILQIASLVILLYLLYQWWFVKREAAVKSQWALFGSVILLNIIVLLAANDKRKDERGGLAGIVMQAASMYEGADERSGEVMELGPGNKVFFQDEIADWYKVILEDKDVGWIKKEVVEKI